MAPIGEAGLFALGLLAVASIGALALLYAFAEFVIHNGL